MISIDKIKTKEILKWSWQEIWDNKLSLASTLLFVVFLNYKNNGLAFALKSTFGTLRILLIFNSITNTDLGVEARKIPNQGIRYSFNNALTASIFLGSLLVILNLLVRSTSPDLTSVIIWLFGAVIGGYVFGGEACIQHLILRLILYRKGLIPWDFANFLDYATERLFLQRIGGRYRFMHDLLREHFIGVTYWKFQHSLIEHSKSVRQVVVHPNGQVFASCAFDGTIKIYNLTTKQVLYQLVGQHTRLNSKSIVDTFVTSISISPDGKILASSGNDGNVKLWELDTGKLIRTLSHHNNYSIWCIAISPNGETLATGGNRKICVFNLHTGEIIHTLNCGFKEIESVAFSPDGETLASGGDNTIKLWNVQTGKLQHTLIGNFYRNILQKTRPLFNKWGVTRSGSIYSVTFSSDSRTLISASAGNGIELWSTRTGKQTHALSSISNWYSSVAISPNGKILAAGSGEGVIELFNLEKNQSLGTLRGHSDTINTVTFDPDGEILISGSDDSKINIWKIFTSLLNSSSFASHSKFCWSKLAPKIILIVSFFYIFLSLFTEWNITNTQLMIPTLRPDEIILVDKFSYNFKKIKRGDLIALEVTPNLVKRGFPKGYRFYRRVIALPGENVVFKGGKVYVNHHLLQQRSASVKDTFELDLDSKFYAVITDNQEYQGNGILAVAEDEYIVGKVIFRIFPLNRIGIVK